MEWFRTACASLDRNVLLYFITNLTRPRSDGTLPKGEKITVAFTDPSVKDYKPFPYVQTCTKDLYLPAYRSAEALLDGLASYYTTKGHSAD
jgi:hypothetical protein